MFPRLRQITRLFFAAVFLSVLLFVGILNMGHSSTADIHTQYLDTYLPSRVLSSSRKSDDPLKQSLSKAFTLPRTPDRLRAEENENANSFVRNVRYRFNMAGLQAIREMRMALPPFEVRSPAPPINPHNFRYIYNPSQICSRQPFLTFLIYIHSAPANLKRRQIIRQTWGNPQLLSLFNGSMIFALGAPPEALIQKTVDMEFEEYGDILQEDYKDAYRNLTYKGISVLKWAHNFCSQTLFVIKTDDDILLDIVSIVDHILTKTVPERGAKKLVLCNLWTTMKVIRDPKSKWGLSKEEFPPDTFPPYCSGSAYIFSGDMIPMMYHTALHSPFFWVDDYFISGLLVNKLGVKHERFNSAYLLNGLQVEDKLANDSRTFMVVHIKHYPLFFKAWNLLMKRHSGMAAYLRRYSTLNTFDLLKKFSRTFKNQSQHVPEALPESSSAKSEVRPQHTNLTKSEVHPQRASLTNTTKHSSFRPRPARS